MTLAMRDVTYERVEEALTLVEPAVAERIRCRYADVLDRMKRHEHQTSLIEMVGWLWEEIESAPRTPKRNPKGSGTVRP